MRFRPWRIALVLCAFVVASLVAVHHVGSAQPRSYLSAKQQAREILRETGVQGGLIVHIGCGEGRLTAALHANDSYIVQGLDRDRDNVNKAREYVQSLGLYGKVTVEQLAGRRLPYVENLVNLVVAEDLGDVSLAEVERVLAPGGVAYVKRGGAWRKITKPWPKEYDEWTHYLHDATNNCVSNDTAVGPPRHVQWVGSPRWSRHHDRMASMSALVCANGRIFYIIDEGPRCSIMLPSRWALVARDAFSGTILWKRRILRWHTRLWPFKSGPAQLQRRLVAVGDRVYVTLGLYAPLTELDAATGKTIRVYDQSRATEEVIASQGVLFLVVNDSPQEIRYVPKYRSVGQAKARVAEEWPWDEKQRWLTAVEAETGKILWRKRERVVPLTLAADSKHVVFHDGERIVCLERATGNKLWTSEPVERRSPIPTNFGPTLVLYRDLVLFFGGRGTETALSLKDGKILWTEEHPRSGHNSPEDLFVINNLVWAGAIAAGRDSGVFYGRDPYTGEVKVEFPPDVETYWFHHRCYRAKATQNYILTSRTGIEFVDFRKKHWEINHWVRGGCIYGVMPANGMVYAPPHSCACYLEAKLCGFNALAPAGTRRFERGLTGQEPRLERGPAFGKVAQRSGQAAEEWPTYRHDGERSGHTQSVVSSKLQTKWQKRLGGRLSSLVISGGTVYVADIDSHRLYALSSEDGTERWSYIAGGRIDSPPTVSGGYVVFGCRDGWVYCLREEDGALVWRFRAAPSSEQVMSYEQLESVWPVHGSVLVRDGAVYCVAGRSMFLDGGLRLYRLELATGKMLSETVLDERDPETGKTLQAKIEGLNMPVALPDILSTDGRFVYMRTQQFDLQGKRTRVITHTPDVIADQQGEGAHLFCPTGFLDGSWFHRSYWVYGKRWVSGAGGWPRAGRVAPAGRILAFDEASVYGYGRKPEYFKWSTPLEYHLFATSKAPKIITRRGQQGRAQSITYNWSQEIPFYVRAMVLAGKTLFVAGPPDVVNEEEAFDRFADPKIQAQLEEQVAVLNGRDGSLLWAVSTSDGAKVAEYKLDFIPVWDGMAAAYGRLFLATNDGRVVCLG